MAAASDAKSRSRSRSRSRDRSKVKRETGAATSSRKRSASPVPRTVVPKFEVCITYNHDGRTHNLVPSTDGRIFMPSLKAGGKEQIQYWISVTDLTPKSFYQNGKGVRFTLIVDGKVCEKLFSEEKIGVCKLPNRRKLMWTVYAIKATEVGAEIQLSKIELSFHVGQKTAMKRVHVPDSSPLYIAQASATVDHAHKLLAIKNGSIASFSDVSEASSSSSSAAAAAIQGLCLASNSSSTERVIVGVTKIEVESLCTHKLDYINIYEEEACQKFEASLVVAPF